MKIDIKIKKTFEYFIQVISQNKEYIFKPNYNEAILIYNFSNFLKQEFSNTILGPNWFFSYFSFQFEYWREKNTIKGDVGLTDISWIIGKKAYDRWIDRSSYSTFFVSVGLLHIHKFNIKDLEIIFGYEGDKMDLNKADDLIRKRYLGEGLSILHHCISNYVYANSVSDICNKCSYFDLCSKLKPK